MTLHTLPTLNAALNATSAVFLVIGYAMIRRKRIGWHVACMLSALGASTVFLGSYLFYHARVGSLPFPGTGAGRVLYRAILISHTALALVIVPLVIRTLQLALRKEYKMHERVARVTLPLWLYVSVTGVVVYWMLYRMRW